jgi:hypothetical protein
VNWNGPDCESTGQQVHLEAAWVAPQGLNVMQHKRTEILRWFMVIPAAIIGWWLAIVTGIVLVSIPDNFCPPEDVMSGFCTAPWYEPVVSGIMIYTASLSAVLALVFSVLTAPGKRDLVATGVFVAGCLCAVYFAFWIAAWAECAGAIVFGLVTLIFLSKRYRLSDAA